MLCVSIAYMTNVTPTHQCLDNLAALNGVTTPIRVGGTTQDRAVSVDYLGGSLRSLLFYKKEVLWKEIYIVLHK